MRFIVLLVTICGCGGAAANNTAHAPPSTHASEASACAEIARACHPHESHSSLASECHHLGHKAASEEACEARKQECLAACPAGGATH